jgi:hypothetical protein
MPTKFAENLMWGWIFQVEEKESDLAAKSKREIGSK